MIYRSIPQIAVRLFNNGYKNGFIIRILGESLEGKRLWSRRDGEKLMLMYRRSFQ